MKKELVKMTAIPNRIETDWKTEYYDELDDVLHYINICEGIHEQQVSYSTYHKALTQICFNCKVVRTDK